jgi:hypothetical protein
VIKKKFRKKPMYNQEDLEIQLLEPFNYGTIVKEEMTEKLIFVNFISGPEVGICMPPNTYIHEVEKEATMVRYTCNGTQI